MWLRPTPAETLHVPKSRASMGLGWAPNRRTGWMLARPFDGLVDSWSVADRIQLRRSEAPSATSKMSQVADHTLPLRSP